MSTREAENGRESGRETKAETKRESERDVICLQSIGCTSDHSWDPTIICFHLSASFHFFFPTLFNTFSPYFFSLLIPIQLRAGCIGWPLVNCSGALHGDRQTLTRWRGRLHSTLSNHVCVCVCATFCIYKCIAFISIFLCPCSATHRQAKYTPACIMFLSLSFFHTYFCQEAHLVALQYRTKTIIAQLEMSLYPLQVNVANIPTITSRQPQTK